MRACVHKRLCDDVMKSHGFVVKESCPHNCKWYEARAVEPNGNVSRRVGVNHGKSFKGGRHKG